MHFGAITVITRWSRVSWKWLAKIGGVKGEKSAVLLPLSPSFGDGEQDEKKRCLSSREITVAPLQRQQFWRYNLVYRLEVVWAAFTVKMKRKTYQFLKHFS